MLHSHVYMACQDKKTRAALHHLYTHASKYIQCSQNAWCTISHHLKQHNSNALNHSYTDPIPPMTTCIYMNVLHIHLAHESTGVIGQILHIVIPLIASPIYMNFLNMHLPHVSTGHHKHILHIYCKHYPSLTRNMLSSTGTISLTLHLYPSSHAYINTYKMSSLILNLDSYIHSIHTYAQPAQRDKNIKYSTSSYAYTSIPIYFQDTCCRLKFSILYRSSSQSRKKQHIVSWIYKSLFNIMALHIYIDLAHKQLKHILTVQLFHTIHVTPIRTTCYHLSSLCL